MSFLCNQAFDFVFGDSDHDVRIAAIGLHRVFGL